MTKARDAAYLKTPIAPNQKNRKNLMNQAFSFCGWYLFVLCFAQGYAATTFAPISAVVRVGLRTTDSRAFPPSLVPRPSFLVAPLSIGCSFHCPPVSLLGQKPVRKGQDRRTESRSPQLSSESAADQAIHSGKSFPMGMACKHASLSAQSLKLAHP